MNSKLPHNRYVPNEELYFAVKEWADKLNAFAGDCWKDLITRFDVRELKAVGETLDNVACCVDTLQQNVTEPLWTEDQLETEAIETFADRLREQLKLDPTNSRLRRKLECVAAIHQSRLNEPVF